MSDTPTTPESTAESPDLATPKSPPGSSLMEQLGTHALGTASGVIGGVVAGAVVGIAAGPVGSLAGAIGGAIAGGMLGSGSVGESPVTGPAVADGADSLPGGAGAGGGPTPPSGPAE
jgi:hypothetical protein